MVTAYSRRLASLLASLRPDFAAYASAFASLSVRKAHLAPAFMKAYGAWHRETGRPFVAFVQQLDPSVPAAKADYVNHPSFQSACYLRRLVEAPETRAGVRRSELTPFDVAAITLKSAVPAEHLDFALSQIKHVSRWRDRDIERLRERVAAVRAVALLPHQPRLVRRQQRGAIVAKAAESSRQQHVH